ncbi:hypothetical protein LXA43DRAFT_15688 [Ganoderma leucocontextum]|nr:hypothetical protein LXA43DRAFT_15688 [Ganoderma leucocontextum]
MANVQLPVELFQLIVESCPRPTRKTLLFVSKMFHDLALPLLFSRITLTFGIKRRPGRHWSRDDPWTEEETAQLSKYNSRSFAILQHLEQDISLAKIVRSLSVRWYEFPFGRSTTLALEAVGRALSALSNLESFEWRGNGHIIPQHAAEALRRCENLRSLLISPMQFLWPDLFELRKLTQITLMVSLNEWIPSITNMPAADRERYESALRLVDLNAASLEDVTTSYWMFPSAPLPKLKHATFLRAIGATGLERLIQHSPLLTSLTLTASAWNVDGILSAFASSPEAFPHLTEFKFLVEYTHDMRDCDANPIAAFLQNKQHLRRLHLDLCSEQSQPIIRLLPKLPNLEDLGLGWGGMQFTAARESLFADCLPRNLRALSIKLHEDRAVLEAFLRLIKQRPTLKVCYVSSLPYLSLEVLVGVLADKECSVELVGVGNTLCYTCRPTNDTHHRNQLAGMHSLCDPDIDPSLTMADYGLDGWQWLAQHGADLGEITISSAVCSSDDVDARVLPLVDIVDLRPLEGSCYVLDHRGFGLD